jgi:ABC-2 type transport system permease protein
LPSGCLLPTANSWFWLSRLRRVGEQLGVLEASGAVFPLDVLPDWLRPIGYFMPTTYWLELLRRSLVGNVAQAFPTLSGFNNMQILGILLGLSLFFGIISLQVFKICDRIARERGMIDRTTNY